MHKPIVVIVSVLLSACAGAVHGPVIEGKWRSGGTDALIEGILQFENGCLYVGHPDDPHERYPVVWPRGTSWHEGEAAVRLQGGALAYPADTISGGGGFHDASSLDPYTSAEGQALAQACVDNTYDEIAVFNSGESIEVRR